MKKTVYKIIKDIMLQELLGSNDIKLFLIEDNIGTINENRWYCIEDNYSTIDLLPEIASSIAFKTLENETRRNEH